MKEGGTKMMNDRDETNIYMDSSIKYKSRGAFIF